MPNSAEILPAIYRAIDDHNGFADADKHLAKSPDTPLYSRGSVLDSIQFVSLIVAIEREIDDAFGVALVLANDSAMSQSRSPFRTVGSLAEYIAQQLGEKSKS